MASVRTHPSPREDLTSLARADMVVDEYNLFQRYKLQKACSRYTRSALIETPSVVRPLTISKDRKLKDEVMWKAFSALLRGHITQLLPVLILSWPLLRFCNFSYVASLPSLYAFTTSTLVCAH